MADKYLAVNLVLIHATVFEKMCLADIHDSGRDDAG